MLISILKLKISLGVIKYFTDIDFWTLQYVVSAERQLMAQGKWMRSSALLGCAHPTLQFILLLLGSWPLSLFFSSTEEKGLF